MSQAARGLPHVSQAERHAAAAHLRKRRLQAAALCCRLQPLRRAAACKRGLCYPVRRPRGPALAMLCTMHREPIDLRA